MKFTEGKPLLWSGVVVIVLFIGVASYWLLTPGMEVLLRELPPEELDNVSAELTVLDIQHSIDREKGTISVAHKDVFKAKKAVMESGNAFRQVVGFELFNESDFGVTDFAQRVNYQRALEGELSRTISSLDDIRDARVHLVLPEKKLFSSDKEKVRASITIYLDPGKQLGPNQVYGVKKIVESSVPKIDAENISIVNQSGEVLVGSASDDYAGGRPLQEKIRVENYLMDKMRSVLDGSLGTSRYVADVDVTLDTDRKTVQTERLLAPDDGSGVSKIRETENSGTGEKAGKKSKSKEVSYQYGREISNVEYSGYEITSVNVGVVVDQTLDNVDIEELKSLIESVLGMRPDRGDRITIIKNNIALKKAFEKYEAAPAPAPVHDNPDTPVLSNQKLILLVLSLLGVFVITFLVKAISSNMRYRRISRQLQHWVDMPTNVVQIDDQ
ncbi:flagellar basal-body MS-ring/collar protein FliF [Microbulbifer sp. SAOS-129_SWC]|uniref:flagellar basal-body MS-ring/collar protein FliF n=1 Tax=Microbulbifer sp. SAOS-129_SWC TaxID=3145235 RepID=UPI00321799C1